MPEIRVSVGFCTPIRDQVLTALKPYGVVVSRYDTWGEGRYDDQMIVVDKGKVADDEQWAVKHVAALEVSQEAVEWVEYLLLRTKRFTLESRLYNPKNAKWAARWEDMPRAWIQPGCEVSAEGKRRVAEQIRARVDQERNRELTKRTVKTSRRAGSTVKQGGILDSVVMALVGGGDGDRRQSKRGRMGRKKYR